MLALEDRLRATASQWLVGSSLPNPTAKVDSASRRLQMIHVVTDSLLKDHLECNSKSYLRLHGSSGQATEYSAFCSRLDARHLASASQWLAAQSTTGRIGHFGGSRLQNMATGDEIIFDAVGAADGLETQFHALQRTEDHSHLGLYHYRPIRFYRHPQPNFVVHLLLAFDALILGHLQGVLPRTREFSFVALRLGGSAYAFKHISIPWLLS
jgi:hypothetical protein